MRHVSIRWKLPGRFRVLALLAAASAAAWFPAPRLWAQRDLLTAGRHVEVRTAVEGDLAVAGANVTVSESVAGYVLAAGSNVAIAGPVANDLWAAGATVVVSAPVGDNARLAGASVRLEPGATVNGRAALAGDSVEVLSAVRGDLVVAGGTVTLSGEIGGSVRALAGQLNLRPGARIAGDLVVTSPHPPDIAADASVEGRVVHHEKEIDRDEPAFLGWLAGWVWMFLATLVLGVAALALSREGIDRTAANLRRRPLAAFLAGFAAWILAPALSLFLAVTVIGIPLALALLCLFGMAAILASVFVAHLAGQLLLTRMGRATASPYLAMAAGALVVAFLVTLPWVGWLLQLVVLAAGLGALVLEGRTRWKTSAAPAAAA